MNVEYGAAPLDLAMTQRLCRFLTEFSYADLPDAVIHEAKRGLLDWLGCAMAGSGHPTVAIQLEVMRSLSGAPCATVLAHGCRLGLLEAPIVNGQMGHVLDYDDTHLDGVVLHASSPVLSALLALVDARGGTGRDLITAYVAGFEAGVRVGKAAPRHHDGGWHLTGTLGTIAAGVASGRFIGLDAASLVHCSGIATTQASGMQQNRGTMCKSFHAGRAASNGLLAALLAEKGFDSSPEIFEGRRGFVRIYSSEAAPGRILEGLGEHWEIASNGYKPYACGIVQHPCIDAMIQLAAESGIAPGDVEHYEIRVNPAAVRITGVEEPETGLKSKFSLKHSAAVGYLDGNAGIPQYSDARATAQDIKAARAKITIATVDSYGIDEAEAEVVAIDGRRHVVHVDHATGTVENPLSDSQIEDKFRANTEPVLGVEKTRLLADLVWRLDTLDECRSITAAAF
ncbi:MAG: hypothetical protein RLZ98_2201 [Pseudomonadota bacterium]|jgi:2-methylcitrate dehydratase PrpD